MKQRLTESVKWPGTLARPSPASMARSLGTACIINVGQRLLAVDCRRLASEIVLPGILPPHRLTASVTISSSMVETHRLHLTDCLAGPNMHDVTRILCAIEEGNPQAAEQLLPLVYEELRKLAAAKLAQEKPGQTLQATALVHEAWLRVVNVDRDAPWNSRHHFFAAAAEAMRRVLVDAARRKASVKHGGYLQRAEFDEGVLAAPGRPEEVLAVHEALDGLAAEDALTAELVKLHYFGGLPIEEAAECLGLSRATAYRMWTYARAWLRAALSDQPPGP